jgi:uncharacterized membrane protein
MYYNQIIGLHTFSKKINEKESAIDILGVKSKKITLINILIMVALGLLTVCAAKLGNTFNIVVAIIPSWLILVFKNTIKNIVSQDKTNIILNLLVYSTVYLVIYHMILLIFGIDIEIIVKLLFLQIFVEIYCISSSFADNMKYINKEIFYAVFFTILISLIIYGFYKNLKFIDITLLSACISSIISALYIGIVSFRSSEN